MHKSAVSNVLPTVAQLDAVSFSFLKDFQDHAPNVIQTICLWARDPYRCPHGQVRVKRKGYKAVAGVHGQLPARTVQSTENSVLPPEVLPAYVAFLDVGGRGPDILHHAGPVVQSLSYIQNPVKAGPRSMQYSQNLPLAGDGNHNSVSVVNQKRSVWVERMVERRDVAPNIPVTLAGMVLAEAVRPSPVLEGRYCTLISSVVSGFVDPLHQVVLKSFICWRNRPVQRHGTVGQAPHGHESPVGLPFLRSLPAWRCVLALFLLPHEILVARRRMHDVRKVRRNDSQPLESRA